ncbi:MAG: hypothetical protein AUJ75_01570 [Candidatus Omnitrophica bacterium CG1_02_49_10]|nr:MAG: hypothetical protein AUJ75_01570 [Candidatus Omnitrophica bacterium CG1_02_49_10]
MKILIVDGYNAINRIPYLADIADNSLEDARRAVFELANEYKRKDGGISEVYVVFDGKNEYRDMYFARPKGHVFSKSGQGDQKIVDMVRKFSEGNVVIVASDDNFVRNNSRAHYASLISVSELEGKRRHR